MTGKELKKRLKMTGKTLVDISQLIGMSYKALNQMLKVDAANRLVIDYVLYGRK